MSIEQAVQRSFVQAEAGERRWRLFFLLIVVTTLLPFAAMPAAVFFGAKVESLLMASVLINFLGGHAHVASTAFFYTDPVMRQHFRENRVRYVWIPIGLVLGTGLFYVTAPPALAKGFLLFYFMWQTHHYQRQNFGILSFLAASTDRQPVRWIERLCLELAVVCGMLALVKVYGLSTGTALEPFTDWIYRTAGVCYLFVPVLILIAVATTPALRQNLMRLLALTLFAAFYVPSFMFSDPAAATLGYALAHGLQYLVFMSFVGVSRPRPLVGLITVSVFAIGGGLLLTVMSGALSDSALGKLLFGMALGGVMSHFVIDAGVWKLRQPFQRQYMRRAFAFVFERKAR
jgi:hypothetical protein